MIDADTRCERLVYRRFPFGLGQCPVRKTREVFLRRPGFTGDRYERRRACRRHAVREGTYMDHKWAERGSER